MDYKGEYWDLEETKDGYKHINVRVNPDDIMDELQRSINHLKNRIRDLENELIIVKGDKYKDEELQKMKNELEEIKSERYYGFTITKEEYEKINAWIDDWFNRKRGGNHYMGTSGGGFTYKFYPTGIGVSGKVIAPDGEEFQFQELG